MMMSQKFSNNHIGTYANTIIYYTKSTTSQFIYVFIALKNFMNKN